MGLIAGSCGMILTMAVHPSGHIAAAQLPDMVRKLILVHGFALSCVPVLFLGALGLSRRLETQNRLGVTGLVVFAFALIAVMNAAVADGLVTPSVLERIVASSGSQSAIDTWTMFSRYTFILNQAFAQVYVAASSVAIMVWSAAVWRSRNLPRGLGVYGLHNGDSHNGGNVLRSPSAGRPRVWRRHARAGNLVCDCRSRALERRCATGSHGVSNGDSKGWMLWSVVAKLPRRICCKIKRLLCQS